MRAFFPLIGGMKYFSRFLIIAVVLSFGVSCETTSSSSSSASANQASATVKPYPLSTCLVTGEALGSKGKPITKVYKGQEVKFCCKPCQMAFNKNPEVFLAKIQ